MDGRQRPAVHRSFSRRKETRPSLTKEQIAEYKEAFTSFVNRSEPPLPENEQKNVKKTPRGRARTPRAHVEPPEKEVITLEIMGNIMRSLFQDPTPKELKEMIREVDQDGNEKIDFEEFLMLASHGDKQIDNALEMKEAFRIFDRNGEGHVTAEQIQSVFHSIGNKSIMILECQHMINELDTHGKGVLLFDDFFHLMNRQRTVSEQKRISSIFSSLKLSQSQRHQGHNESMPDGENDEQEISEDDVNQLFDMFDSKGNDKVSVDELEAAFNLVGEDLTEDELKYLMEKVLVTSGGELHREDFHALFQKRNRSPSNPTPNTPTTPTT